ncbi:hypothetical protein [Gulbenkiania mobilis]|nr:hypothetical protein [Gulbenkiania mobilis]
MTEHPAQEKSVASNEIGNRAYLLRRLPGLYDQAARAGIWL